MSKNYTAWQIAGEIRKVDGRRVCPACTKIIRYIPHHDPLGAQPVAVAPVFLVKKINKNTQDWFYGCPNFPDCHHSENRPMTKMERDIKTRSWANSLHGPNP